MLISFDPLNPTEANAVRSLLAPAQEVLRVLTAEESAALKAAEVPPQAEAGALADPAPAAAPQPAEAKAPAKPRGRPAKAQAAPEAPPAAAPPVETPPAAPAPVVPSVGDLLANSQAAPAAPATAAPPPAASAPAAGKAPTVEDVRAAYRDLFAVVGEEPGKVELRAVLAKAGAATVSDLKADAYPAVIRGLNAAAIVAKSKAAAPAAPVKDPLL